jgi:cobalamin biosynthesis Mg chelatase CobN
MISKNNDAELDACRYASLGEKQASLSGSSKPCRYEACYPEGCKAAILAKKQKEEQATTTAKVEAPAPAKVEVATTTTRSTSTTTTAETPAKQQQASSTTTKKRLQQEFDESGALADPNKNSNTVDDSSKMTLTRTIRIRHDKVLFYAKWAGIFGMFLFLYLWLPARRFGKDNGQDGSRSGSRRGNKNKNRGTPRASRLTRRR